MNFFNMKTGLDWTHKKIKIVDIRKLQKLYVLKVSTENSDNEDTSISPIFINATILNDRIKSYFLTSNVEKISRGEICDLVWNMYITKGRFFKFDKIKKELFPEEKNPEKFYISFLEVDGPLGSFESIISK